MLATYSENNTKIIHTHRGSVAEFFKAGDLLVGYCDANMLKQ